MGKPLLEVNNADISYNHKVVVRNFSISLEKGEILGIVGESGSGKTTVIKGIMGLLGSEGNIEKGDIYFKGRDIKNISDEEMRDIRGDGIGMIFQNCESALCPVRKIKDQLFESLNEHIKISKEQMTKEALHLMSKLNLNDGERILNSYPFEMSGGMNQRVGILMAMMLKPEVLLADEPTSALDVTVQAQVVKEMMKIRDEYNTGIVIVSHNIGVISYMADKIAVMHNGNLIEYGETKQVINEPREDYTKELLSSVLRINKG